MSSRDLESFLRTLLQEAERVVRDSKTTVAKAAKSASRPSSPAARPRGSSTHSSAVPKNSGQPTTIGKWRSMISGWPSPSATTQAPRKLSAGTIDWARVEPWIWSGGALALLLLVATFRSC